MMNKKNKYLPRSLLEGNQLFLDVRLISSNNIAQRRFLLSSYELVPFWLMFQESATYEMYSHSPFLYLLYYVLVVFCD